MSVAFPSGYYMERTSVIDVDLNSESDQMSDGEVQTRIMGDVFFNIRYEVKSLSRTDMYTLGDFWIDNRGEEITITIDTVDYIGRIVSNVKQTMTGSLFNLAFTLRLKVV